MATLTMSGTSKFVYLPPPPNTSKQELRGRVVLVEKLGHYRYSDGGVWETADGSSRGWHDRRDYATLAEKYGLSIEALSERASR